MPVVKYLGFVKRRSNYRYETHDAARFVASTQRNWDEVRRACELLGLDPLYIANEGKQLAFVSPEDADRALEIIRSNPLGKNACIIGEVIEDYPKKVMMETVIGGTRIIDMLSGESLTRIC